MIQHTNFPRRSLPIGIIMLIVAAMTATATAAIAQPSDGQEIAVKGSSMLDARQAQVLFVDLQPELIRRSQTVKPAALAANAAVLARVARLTQVPVTFSIVPVQGEPGRNLPDLADYASAHNTFQRVMAGTFMEPRLVAALDAHQRKTLVIAGYASEVAVLQTVLGARSAGYRVYVVVDASGSQSARTEDAALKQMEMAGAIPTSVLAVAAQLAPDFSRRPGSEVLATFDALSPP